MSNHDARYQGDTLDEVVDRLKRQLDRFAHAVGKRDARGVEIAIGDIDGAWQVIRSRVNRGELA